MRYLITLTTLFCCVFLQAQIEYCHSYIYPLPKNNDNAYNVRLFEHNNEVYTIPYTGGMYKIDNQNEELFYPFTINLTNLKSINSDSSTYEILYPSKRIVYRKNLKKKIFDIPKNIIVEKNIVYKDKIYFISSNNRIYVFNDSVFQVKKQLEPNYSYSFLKNNDNCFLVKSSGYNVYLYDLKSFKIVKKFFLKDFSKLHYFSDSCVIYENNNKDIIRYDYKNHQLLKKYNNRSFYNQWKLNRINTKTLKLTDLEKQKDYYINTNSYIFNFIVDERNKAVYLGTIQRPKKSFLYLQKIPNAFGEYNSSSCFTLSEDKNGNLWAGSYNKNLSIIKKDTIIIQKNNSLKFLIGSISLGDAIYFTTEGSTNGGIWGISENKKPFYIKGSNKEETMGYYLFKSFNNKIYYGTEQKGLWEIDEKDLKLNNGNWRIIEGNQIDKIGNILTVTEDKYGRIYFAGSLGIGVYKNNKTEYFLAKDSFLPKPMSSLTDAYGTVWFGGKDGLHYITPTKNNIKKTDFKKLNHAFFNENLFVTALSINQNYLIIANQNKVLALDLKKFHESNEINIKYLTAQETGFNSTTEQNTTLTAKDSSIWFSTSDMIYHWDFNTWLNLPKPKINPEINLITKEKKIKLTKSKKIRLSPFESTFKITFDYSSPDKLPRYIQYAFQEKNNSIEWSKINTESEFIFQNLKAGNYIFHLKIFELDGSISYYKYFIKIPKFLHELWYFWLIIGGTIISIISYVIYTHQNAKTKLANWELEKEKVNKELSQLQLTSISNQFRPHFLLNTFNSIGAYLESGSYEEAVLDTMGKSINILFSTAKKEQNHHSLKKEWELVRNLIKIYRLVYIKDLQTKIPSKKEIKLIGKIRVPFGILQIPIENALLHGLHNKPNPPYLLKILLENNDTDIVFRIIDNGVGVQKASTLSNVRKNGTGLKNLHKIITVFNQYNSNKIIFSFIENTQEEGTEIKITIPKNFNYEISS